MERYKFLTEEEAIEYVRSHTSIFLKNERLVAKALTGNRASVDGYANHILRVQSTSSEESVIIKQVLPFIRAAKENGEDVPVNMARLFTEVQYMRTAETICPEISPEIFSWNQKNGTLIMEDLGRMKILRYELMQGKIFPSFPERMGAFLGKIAYFTSEQYLTTYEKQTIEAIFDKAKAKRMWGKFIFDDPVLANQENPINPLVRNWVDQLYADEAVRREVRMLKSNFNQSRQCLIHTDLHTSNIFVSDEELKIFDSEFARFGPIGFDLGRLLGSLALNFASLLGFQEWAEERKRGYQFYLLETIHSLFESFDKMYCSLWDKHQPARVQSRDRTRDLIFQQTLGYMACTMMARIYDHGLCQDFQRIESLEERAKGQRFIIEMARRLFIRRYHYRNMEEVVDEMRELSLHHKQNWN